MANLIAIEGHKNIHKDPQSNAIINTETSSFDNFKERKRREKLRDARISKLESKVDAMTELLQKIHNKL